MFSTRKVAKVLIYDIKSRLMKMISVLVSLNLGLGRSEQDTFYLPQ